MSDEDLEKDTAVKWAARSIACCVAFAKSKDRKWLVRANDYKHEALEHAALVKDKGATVNEVQTEIERQAAELLRKK